MIKFDRVSKRYPNGKDALRRINFELPAGQLTFLTGHSGAGKSTLLKLIMMIERPTQGQVFVEGQNLNGFSTRQVPFLRRKIGMVHQNHQLLFDRSVFDNVALPLVIAGFARADIGKRVRAALDKVGLLNKEKLNPIMLSGGEQQRVGIARAVVNKPPLLLADEPTGNLDERTADQVQDLMLELNQRLGTAFLVVTHDHHFAGRCQSRHELHDGLLHPVA
ncbi:MAG TPA: cell division ATP-binding protein FtsE [Alcanivorax sp.]|nr:cell division ATP-binding protein FtsE [Alcanivorax sp.]